MSQQSYDRRTDQPAEDADLLDFYHTTATLLVNHGECDTDGELYGFPEILIATEGEFPSVAPPRFMHGTKPVAHRIHLTPQTLGSFFPMATGVLPLLHAGVDLCYEEPYYPVSDRYEAEDGCVFVQLRGQLTPVGYYVAVDEAGQPWSGLFTGDSSEFGPVKSLELLILSSLVKSLARLARQRKGIQHREVW